MKAEKKSAVIANKMTILVLLGQSAAVIHKYKIKIERWSKYRHASAERTKHAMFIYVFSLIILFFGLFLLFKHE